MKTQLRASLRTERKMEAMSIEASTMMTVPKLRKVLSLGF